MLNLSVLEKTPRETLRSEIRVIVVQILMQEKRLPWDPSQTAGMSSSTEMMCWTNCWA